MNFTVPGNPIPKGRPRVGRGGNVFTPSRTVSFERLVAIKAREAMAGAGPTEAPLCVEMEFYLESRRRVDIDNLFKSIADGGNGVVWKDDSQIVSAYIRKAYDGLAPRTEVYVYERCDGVVRNGKL